MWDKNTGHNSTSYKVQSSLIVYQLWNIRKGEAKKKYPSSNGNDHAWVHDCRHGGHTVETSEAPFPRTKMSGKGAKGLSGKGLSGKGAKGTMSAKKGDKRKPTSRSVKAGLQFPVGRIHRFLKVRIYKNSSQVLGHATRLRVTVHQYRSVKVTCDRLNLSFTKCGMLLLLFELRLHFINIWLSLIFQNRAASGGRVGATAAVYSAAILGMLKITHQWDNKAQL